MKIKMFPATILAIGIALLNLIGCNTSPSPGIEAGNPDIDVKTIRVVTSASTYDISFLDESTASVARTFSTNGSLETVVVPYRRQGTALELEAGFSDGENAGISTILDGDGDVVSGVLKINGEPVVACFEVPDISPECPESDAPQEEPTDAPALDVPTDEGAEEDSAAYALGDHTLKPEEDVSDGLSSLDGDIDPSSIPGLGEEEEPEPTGLLIPAPMKTSPALPQRPLRLAR